MSKVPLKDLPDSAPSRTRVRGRLHCEGWVGRVLYQYRMVAGSSLCKKTKAGASVFVSLQRLSSLFVSLQRLKAFLFGYRD